MHHGSCANQFGGAHCRLIQMKSQAAGHRVAVFQPPKAIPSMIQIAIKKSMKPAKDKLKSLCSIVEVLESEVISLRREVAADLGQNGMPK
ncbi:hypothetical protein HAX54_048025 [Datura stramonium]|uniref:Uncharacterized protein n=1 Tax=Datura stramonium TaxID=4076 RepID=A0ABS8WLD3_DATST|nr:hypothetical protein [Datura stramonium]